MNHEHEKSKPLSPEELQAIDETARTLSQAIDHLVRKTIMENGCVGKAICESLGVGVLFGSSADILMAEDFLVGYYGGTKRQEEIRTEIRPYGKSDPCQN